MDIQERINKLMENEAFAEEFSKATNAKEVVELFGRNGIDVPMEIAEELFVPAIHMDGELNEDDLDKVAGGAAFAALGSAIGKGVFYGAGYLGRRLAGWSQSKSKNYAKAWAKAIKDRLIV